jgi:hypothetical protein
MKSKVFKFQFVGVALAGLISVAAFAQEDICQDPQQAEAAKEVVSQLRQGLADAGLSGLVSSSGIESCNPTTLMRAALEPGSIPPAIEYRDVCGAILTFSNEADMHTVAQYVSENFKASNMVCVSQDAANSH